MTTRKTGLDALSTESIRRKVFSISADQPMGSASIETADRETLIKWYREIWASKFGR